MSGKPRSVDEYLGALPVDKREALERLRQAIKSAAPEAEEYVAWGMPMYRLKGRMLVGFRAAANHCSFHPMSSLTIRTLAPDLRGYDTSPGTVRFPAKKPLPAALVRKLVKARIAEIRQKTCRP